MRRLAGLLLLILAVAGCDGDAPRAAETATPLPPSDPFDRPVDPVEGDGGVVVKGRFGREPQIAIPDGAPGGSFFYKDLKTGDGEQVVPGSILKAHYTGMSWVNGAVFDSSFGGEATTFSLHQVIRGWTHGIPGMRVGGRRLLVIPPLLGYREQTPGAPIAPNDTLVFVIDLIGIEYSPPVGPSPS